MSRPSMRTRPESGGSRPPMMCSSVLFPAPLCPMMATNSPAPMVNETRSRTARGGRLIRNALDTDSTLTTAVAVGDVLVAVVWLRPRAPKYRASVSATLIDKECFQGRFDGVGDQSLAPIVVGGEKRRRRCWDR